ncbi:hypothetical protein TELCIR_14358, partial [Teladorsagia circumcincta]
PTQMIDYIKQVFITGDVSCIGTKVIGTAKDKVGCIYKDGSNFVLSRPYDYQMEGGRMTFVNLNLHSVPFEDVNEIVEQVQVTKAARKRNEEIETLLRE